MDDCARDLLLRGEGLAVVAGRWQVQRFAIGVEGGGVLEGDVGGFGLVADASGDEARGLGPGRSFFTMPGADGPKRSRGGGEVVAVVDNGILAALDASAVP